jgi:hypothetical protein
MNTQEHHVKFAVRGSTGTDVIIEYFVQTDGTATSAGAGRRVVDLGRVKAPTADHRVAGTTRRISSA